MSEHKDVGSVEAAYDLLPDWGNHPANPNRPLGAGSPSDVYRYPSDEGAARTVRIGGCRAVNPLLAL